MRQQGGGGLSVIRDPDRTLVLTYENSSNKKIESITIDKKLASTIERVMVKGRGDGITVKEYSDLITGLGGVVDIKGMQGSFRLPGLCIPYHAKHKSRKSNYMIPEKIRALRDYLIERGFAVLDSAYSYIFGQQAQGQQAQGQQAQGQQAQGQQAQGRQAQEEVVETQIPKSDESLHDELKRGSELAFPDSIPKKLIKIVLGIQVKDEPKKEGELSRAGDAVPSVTDAVVNQGDGI